MKRILWLAAILTLFGMSACNMSTQGATALPPEPTAFPTITLPSIKQLPTATLPPTPGATRSVSTQAPTAAPTSAPTQAPTAGATGSFVSSGISFLIDPGIAANGSLTNIPEAKSQGEDPFWQAAPAHFEIDLQRYVIPVSFHKPRIYIWPVSDFKKINPNAGTIIDELTRALKEKPANPERLPFLPLFNAGQMFHAQLQYMDFKNGSGVRYVTMYSQAVVPISNFEIIYTYQGLTSDGKYYVSMILPIHNANLPETMDKTPKDLMDSLQADFVKYLDSIVAKLNASPGDFSPGLALFDGLVKSLEIKP